MTLETSLIDSALRNWQSNVDRAGKLFGNLSQEQLLQEVATGKDRLIYLWGHLTASNDALIPLLGFGARIHPEVDLMFVSNPDRTVPTILSGEDLTIIRRHFHPRDTGAAVALDVRRTKAKAGASLRVAKFLKRKAENRPVPASSSANECRLDALASS